MDSRALSLSNGVQSLRSQRLLVRLEKGGVAATGRVFAGHRSVSFWLAEVALSEGAPGYECHSFFFAHGDDVALDVAVGGGPETLVDGELAEAVLSCIC